MIYKAGIVTTKDPAIFCWSVGLQRISQRCLVEPHSNSFVEGCSFYLRTPWVFILFIMSFWLLGQQLVVRGTSVWFARVCFSCQGSSSHHWYLRFVCSACLLLLGKQQLIMQLSHGGHWLHMCTGCVVVLSPEVTPLPKSAWMPNRNNTWKWFFLIVQHVFLLPLCSW